MDNLNQFPQVPEVQNPAPLPVNNSSGSKIIPIVLAVIIVLIIAIGSYILGTKQSQTLVQNRQNSVMPTAIPSPTPDETANWEAFISTRCGLQVQYPNGWSAEDAKLASGNDNPTYNYECITVKAPDHKEIITHRVAGESLDLSISRTTKGATYQSVTINSIDDYLNTYDKSIAPANKVNKNFGNINGVYYEINGFDSFGNFAFESANYIYIASWSNTYKGNYKSYIDQILSTFQFTP